MTRNIHFFLTYMKGKARRDDVPCLYYIHCSMIKEPHRIR